MYFCITGTGRCGTNLLYNMCNLHPVLFMFNETHWIPKMYEFFGLGKGSSEEMVDVIKRTFFVRGGAVTDFNEDAFREFLAGQDYLTVSEFCDIFGTFMAINAGKQKWADKTPDYGPYLSTLQKLWPRVKFVHLIRNGIEVAHSMSKHLGFQWMASAKEMWWIPGSFNKYYESVKIEENHISDYLDLWYWRLKRIRDESTRLRDGSYMEVRFEDLIRDPSDVLEQISHFVGLEVSDDWIQQAVSLVDRKRIRNHADKIGGSNLNQRHLDLLASLGYC